MPTELHTVPGFNRTENDGYSFQDDGSTAEVRVSIPRGVQELTANCRSAKDFVKVTLSENALKVEVKGLSQPLLSCDELWGAIRPRDTTWTLDRNTNEIVVYLSKVDENEPWGSLTKEGKENEAAKAFAQMEKIKKLFEATREGTPEEFDNLFQDMLKDAEDKKDFPLHQVRDGNQKNALHFAAQLGNLTLCKHLVEHHKVPIDSQCSEGETPLSLCAASGQTAVVTYLLESGSSPHVSSSTTSFPIHRSALVGDLEGLKKMVEFGADINAPSDMGTPLHCAAGSGNVPCVEYLLGLKADTQIADTSGLTPLMASVAHCGMQGGDMRTMQLLLDSGADPNLGSSNGATALHIAASMDNVAIINDLVGKGASADCADKDNLKPIHAAAVCGCRQALKKLLAITKRIPGVEWTVEGMIRDAEEKDGYVKDFTIEELNPEDSEGKNNKMKKADIEIKIVDAEKAMEMKGKADAEFRIKKFPQAIELYTQAIELDNSNSAAFANRSASQIQLTNFQAALEDAVIARTLKPDYMKAYYREGMAHQELGNWEEAAQAYFEGCRVENENTELIKRFQHAMKMAKEDHKAKQDD
jgi:ankyrin repeat protein